MTSVFKHCPQCGDKVESLHEGYCKDCCEENQKSLDEHNARYDFWSGLTDKQKDELIHEAVHTRGG